jgi:hypothetical protein
VIFWQTAEQANLTTVDSERAEDELEYASEVVRRPDEVPVTFS